MLAPLRDALAGAPGPRLADIGGGTGNYALALKDAGYQPVVIDRSAKMLAHAAAKGLETVRADAQRLPFAAGSFDAAMLVSMLHHVERRSQALAEARRVLAPGGRLAVMLFTREDISDAWCLEYFPSSRPWLYETHPPLEEVLSELPGARLIPVRFADVQDASLPAMLERPRQLLEAGRRTQTSYFERMQRDHPEELAAGLARLAEELEAGRAPSQPGRGSVVAWIKAPL